MIELYQSPIPWSFFLFLVYFEIDNLHACATAFCFSTKENSELIARDHSLPIRVLFAAGSVTFTILSAFRAYGFRPTATEYNLNFVWIFEQFFCPLLGFRFGSAVGMAWGFFLNHESTSAGLWVPCAVCWHKAQSPSFAFFKRIQ